VTIPPRARPVDSLGLASWAVPERVSTSGEHSSPRAGLPEQARQETEGRHRASLRRRRSQGDRGSGSSLLEAGGAVRCRRPRAALPQPRKPPNHQGAPTVALLGRCRSAVRAIGRQCRSREKRLLPPGRYGAAPAKRCDTIGRRGEEVAVARRSMDPVGAPRPASSASPWAPWGVAPPALVSEARRCAPQPTPRARGALARNGSPARRCRRRAVGRARRQR
jgi:hypothetical protein